MQKNIWDSKNCTWTLFFLIENVFFDWSNLFCVWTMLWVGHLCLNYSIPKKLLQSKKNIFNKKKNNFNQRKNCLNAKKKKSFEVFFFYWTFFFFEWSEKSFEVVFFLNHFDTNVPQWGRVLPHWSDMFEWQVSTPTTSFWQASHGRHSPASQEAVVELLVSR